MHMGKQEPAPERWDEAVGVDGVTTASCWYRELLRGTCSVPWEPGCWCHMKGPGSSEMFDQIFSRRQSPSLASLPSCFPWSMGMVQPHKTSSKATGPECKGQQLLCPRSGSGKQRTELKIQLISGNLAQSCS